MAGDHLDALGMQVSPRREIGPVEEPLRVVIQFVPALVESVERSEEGAGIAGVNLDRTLVTGTDLPDRVELGVVDRHVSSVLVPNTEPERLVKLQSFGPRFKALVQPGRLSIRPARIVDTRKINQGIGEKSARVSPVERFERFFEMVAPPAVEIDDRANPGRIHLGDITLDTLRGEGRLTASEMIVHVDDRKRRLGDFGSLGDQHRARLPVAQLSTP